MSRFFFKFISFLNSSEKEGVDVGVVVRFAKYGYRARIPDERGGVSRYKYVPSFPLSLIKLVAVL